MNFKNKNLQGNQMLKEYIIQTIIALFIPLFVFLYPVSSNDIDAYFFPYLLNWTIIVFLVLHWSIYFIKRQNADQSFNISFNFKKIGIFLILLIVAISLLETLGFYVTSFILYLSIAYLFRVNNNQIKFILISAFIFIAVLYLLFRVILLVQMPSGYFL